MMGDVSPRLLASTNLSFSYDLHFLSCLILSLSHTQTNIVRYWRKDLMTPIKYTATHTAMRWTLQSKVGKVFMTLQHSSSCTITMFMYYHSLRSPNPTSETNFRKYQKVYIFFVISLFFFLYVHVRLTASRVIRLTANNIFCYTITYPNNNPLWLSTWLEVGWNIYAFVSDFSVVFLIFVYVFSCLVHAKKTRTNTTLTSPQISSSTQGVKPSSAIHPRVAVFTCRMHSGKRSNSKTITMTAGEALAWQHLFPAHLNLAPVKQQAYCIAQPSADISFKSINAYCDAKLYLQITNHPNISFSVYFIYMRFFGVVFGPYPHPGAVGILLTTRVPMLGVSREWDHEV